MMNRRDFLSGMSAAVIISACGKFAQAATRQQIDSKTIFRFAIGSDWHYGEPNTPYEQYFQDLKQAFTAVHQQTPCDCFILNGDVIHNEPTLLEPAVKLFKTIHPTVFATRGNHDRVTDAAWEQNWGFPLNYEKKVKGQVLLFGDTSNLAGDFLTPDVAWFAKKLEEHKNAQNIFIFLHITPIKWTEFGASSPEFASLIKKYPNVKAIFNGHDHDQDNVKLLEETIPFLFDSHIGGSWGTKYHGFRIVELKADNTMVTYMLNPTERFNEYTRKAVAAK